MPVKCTFQFNMATLPNETSPRARVADWTEIFWAASDTIDAAKTLLRNGIGAVGGIGLWAARAGILPAAASIVDVQLQRYTVAAGSGGEVPLFGPDELGLSIPGNVKNALRDAPQMALALNLGFLGGVPRRITHHVRAIPDNQIQSGEAALTTQFKGSLQDVFNALSNGWGSYIDRRTGGAQYIGKKLLTVAANGQVNGITPITFAAVDSYVKVKQTKDATGVTRNGVFRVTALGAGGVPILGDWPHGLCKGGIAFQFERVFASFARDERATLTGLIIPQPVFRASVKKVGTRRSYLGRNRRRAPLD